LDPGPVLLDIVLNPILIASATTVVTWIGLLILLLIGSALISASEVAYFSLTHQDINNLQKDGKKADLRVLELKERPRILLATILISNNFINIAIVILSDALIKNSIPESTFNAWASAIQGMFNLNIFSVQTLSSILSFSITIIGVTFLLVLFGEVAPKIYANINNVKHAKVMASSLTFLNKVFYPFSALLVGWSSGFEERVYRKRLHSKGTEKKNLDKAIELTVSKGENREEVDILKGIIKFGDVTAKQIMKPRVDVVALDTSNHFIQVLDTIKESGFSRIPVTTEDFDNIQGVLYVKDLLGHSNEGAEFNWQALIRENVLYVPETKKIDDLMKEFQLKRTHMGIVVDEYGGSAGIVTLEDIFEEVVGDIRDEFDTDEEVEYVKIDDHNFIFEGKSLLNDVVRITGLYNDVFDEGRGDADSLAGFILEIEGMIPKINKVIQFKEMTFLIISVTKRRIEKIKITI
jgi:putative hemolysin